jgi:hypothetical protein
MGAGGERVSPDEAWDRCANVKTIKKDVVRRWSGEYFLDVKFFIVHSA